MKSFTYAQTLCVLVNGILLIDLIYIKPEKL